MYRPCAACGLPVYPDDRVERGKHLGCLIEAERHSIEEADRRIAAARHFASDYVSWGKSMFHRTEDGIRTLCGMLIGADPSSGASGSNLLDANRCTRCEGVRLVR